MVKLLESKKLEDLLKYLIGIVVLILVNQVSFRHFSRIDLTDEQRYSIKPATRTLLNDLDDNVYIEVYLEGELNAGLQRLQKAIRETLEEFDIYSDHKVQYTFVNPGLAMSQKARNEFMADLSARGITPTNIIDEEDGKRTEKIVFPGAIVSYGGAETAVMLLTGTRGEEQLNNSVEGVEYALASAIYKLSALERKKIGFLQGHGELSSENLLSLQNSLFQFYDLTEVSLTGEEPLKDLDLIILAKPRDTFSEIDKYTIDQYIMRGGKALFLVDKLHANMDSASNEINLSLPYQMNLDDMLFRYGIRLNNDLVQDNNAAPYPIVTGMLGGQPQIVSIPWPYFPILNRFADHPISRDLGPVLGQFVSTMDTVKAEGIIKTPLIFTSAYSRSISAPVNISVNDLRKNVKPEDLNKSFLPVAYLLEGKFRSVFKNRFLPEGALKSTFLEDGMETKILVISDGDFVKNEINPRTGNPEELGRYPYQRGITFANADFIQNAIAYLMEENGIITARNKVIAIRPLDKVKITTEKTTWQAINLLLPLLIILMPGGLYFLYRKYRYSNFPVKQHE
ncbi:MAG: gliding motility-associated ABC transporter substrate-binding protein GldG [Cyclobacteriaceae bacterium]|nr:gliding motility-associated ABC transporter substrate-binding protein GldG [Cyclobacteriaceae bacterium]